jgi:predicted transcriptional regulator
MRARPLAGLALATALLAVALCPAQAQPTGAADQAQDVANGTVSKGKSVLDQIGDGVGGAAKGVGDAASDAGKGIGDAAGAFGQFLGQVGAAIATGAQATMGALGDAGLALAAGLSAAVLFVLRGAGDALTTVGAAFALAVLASRDGLAAGFGLLGARLAALFALYADFVGGLRPRQVPATAFTAVVAAGSAATTGAAGYGLWSLLRRFGWLVGFPVAGFTRIEASELLDHPMRAQIFQVIQANPGVHASELSRKVGVGWGTITHHLDKLERARLVTTRRVNNQKCYFEDGGKVSSQDMAIASAVRGDSAGQITTYVQSHPMTSQKMMAAELGMSAALASFHVKKLVGIGVLDKMRRGKETLLTTTQAVRRVMTGPAVDLPAMAATAVRA